MTKLKPILIEYTEIKNRIRLSESISDIIIRLKEVKKFQEEHDIPILVVELQCLIELQKQKIEFNKRLEQLEDRIDDLNLKIKAM